MISLFDPVYRDLLVASINPSTLTSKGFKTFPYLELNIRTLINDEEDEKDYRLVKVAEFSYDLPTNIWFKGYYDYSKVKNMPFDKFLIGKSICPVNFHTMDKHETIDVMNILLDSKYLKEINNIQDVFFYWEQILLTITNDYSCLNVYKDSKLFGLPVRNFIDYIDLAMVYHAYVMVNNKLMLKGTLLEKMNVEITDVFNTSRYDWACNKNKFYEYLENVKRYVTFS